MVSMHWNGVVCGPSSSGCQGSNGLDSLRAKKLIDSAALISNKCTTYIYIYMCKSLILTRAASLDYYGGP